MRIAYLNPSGGLGGAETALRELLASVRAAQPEWELWLVLGQDGPLARLANDLGVRVHIMELPAALAKLGDSGRWRALLGILGAAMPTAIYGRGLARWLQQLQPDIVHTNGLKMHVLGAWTCPRRSALIWHIHDYVSVRPLMRHLLRFFRKACRAAIVNSDSVARDLANVLPGLRITRIYNAVDLRRFTATGAQLDLDGASNLPPAAPGTIRAGLVGTFARWKGQRVFLEALARLGARVPVRGYIIGGPIYQTAGSQWSEQELRDEAVRLGLSDRVGFTGFLEDTPAAMRALDIVVHASTQPEPFGMVIIEAMACGKAVIASRAGGATELISDGATALAHSPGDAASLANQIERLACDPLLRARLGAAGRSEAARKYDGQRLSEQLLTVYEDVTGGAGSAALGAAACPAQVGAPAD